MKKKLLIALVLATVLATGTAFADHPGGFGIGVQGGYGGGVGGGLTFKLPSMPIFWVVDFWSWDSGLGLQVAGDFYFIDSQLIPTLHWYFGLGGYVNLGLGNPLGLAIGARLPIGLSWQPINLLEIYLQFVPSIGLAVLPKIDLYPNFWGTNLGIRLWF